MLDLELFFHQGCEVQLPKQPDKGIAIRRNGFEIAPVQFHVEGRVDRHEFLAQEDLIPIFDERFSLPLGRHLFGVFQAGFDRAEALDQVLCALFSDTRGSRNVVGRIAPETQKIGNLCWSDAEELLDLVRSNDEIVTGRVQDNGFVTDQLHHVFVDRHDDGVYFFVYGTPHEGSDDIVCFLAGNFEDRNAHRGTEPFDVGDLFAEVGRHPFTRGFVRGIAYMPCGGFAAVEHHRDVVGREFLQHPVEHQSEAVRCIRGHTLTVGQPPYRVVGAVHLGHGINDQKQRPFDHACEQVWTQVHTFRDVPIAKSLIYLSGPFRTADCHIRDVCTSERSETLYHFPVSVFTPANLSPCGSCPHRRARGSFSDASISRTSRFLRTFLQ